MFAFSGFCFGIIFPVSCLVLKPKFPDEIASIETSPPNNKTITTLWERFKEGRQLEESRFENFKANVLKAHEANNKQGVDCQDFFDGQDCVFGVTKFSHMTSEEFATRLGAKPPTSSTADKPVLNLMKGGVRSTLVDWRTNATTPVRNQGICGSCWAMSATETIESSVFMATGNLYQLSTQQVVACDPYSWGCDGGLPDYAYEYVISAGGLVTAQEYPDTSSSSGLTGVCHSTGHKTASISDWNYAVSTCVSGACQNQAMQEDNLASVLEQKGPLSVCLSADLWMNYMRGIFSLPSCSSAAKDIDHCVQLVGYNQQAVMPYWILRNSWDTDWGIDGYMYLAMGGNLCGVANYATTVTAIA